MHHNDLQRENDEKRRLDAIDEKIRSCFGIDYFRLMPSRLDTDTVIVYTGNPGRPGQGWVHSRFVRPMPATPSAMKSRS